MKRQQFLDIADQIERTVNSRHSSAPEMHITTQATFTPCVSWIDILPVQTDNRFCDSLYFPEEILPFASVYGLNTQIGVRGGWQDEKPIPCITMFLHEAIED